MYPYMDDDFSGNDILNIHATLPISEANVPGKRFVTWTQGCLLSCPNCHNPNTHSTAQNLLINPNDLFETIMDHEGDIEGVSLTGGEPLLQAKSILHLLRLIKGQSSLATLLFTGYTIEEIGEVEYGTELIKLCDVLIRGPYVEELSANGGWPPSTNQGAHLGAKAYTLDQIVTAPCQEVIIDGPGNIKVTGSMPAYKVFGQ